jgi:hypothetical protein
MGDSFVSLLSGNREKSMSGQGSNESLKDMIIFGAIFIIGTGVVMAVVLAPLVFWH